MSGPRDVSELCQALVRVPSVNPSGDPGTDQVGEKACAELVGDFLEKCGATVSFDEILPDRPNVTGVFPSDRPGKPRLLFAPHTDTVSVAGMTTEPFGGELRDGRIWGRGASDTKGPMAAMLWALWENRERIPRLGYEIVFTGLVGEEAGQEGAYAIAKKGGIDFAIVGEPTRLDIVHTHKGDTTITLTTRGKAAHSSAPALGDNAIEKMMRLLAVVRDQLAPALAAHTDPVLGAPTVSVDIIRGGVKFNIVPDHCEAVIDIRTVPGCAGETVAEIAAPILRAACPEVEIAYRHALPLAAAGDHPIIAALESQGAKRVGAPWFCDAAILAHAGISAIACGPGDIAQAHTDDEWIAVDDLHRGAEFFERFLSTL